MATQADIETLRCELEAWDKAYTAAKDGAAYSVDGITVTRQDIEGTIQPNRRRLHRQILQLEAADNGAAAPSFRVATLTDPWA
jgi:hypothetical protein